MAATKGHGNPRWSREETILALELYHDLKGVIPSGKDARITALSILLRSLPYHFSATKQQSFRNEDGVVFKLLNIRNVATGKGLSNVSEMDRTIWSELGLSRLKTKELANAIRGGIKILEDNEADDEDELEFAEGKAVTRVHIRRERSPKVRKELLLLRKKKETVHCDLCGMVHNSGSPVIQDSIFEAHHIIPLAIAGTLKTKLSDMALLCANCHRLLHKAISIEKKWLSIDEAKCYLMLNKNKESIK